MRVTLKDVAAHAGVSEATASKALNGRGDIADATRNAVLKAAAAVGYVPVRRSSDPGRPTITMVADSIDPYYGVEVLRGLVEEGGRRGIDIVPHIESETFHPANSANEWEDLHLGPSSIGIVVLVYRARGPVFDVAKRRGIPVIAIDPYITSKDADVTISATSWEGGKSATEHLVGLGHRRIAVISGPSEFIPGAERLHGYRAAMEEAGIGVDNDLIIEGKYTFGSGFDVAERIMQLPDPPTAVFALNDRMALGAIRAFESHGLKVPEAISVIGFDNSPGTELMTPALTTIGQPLADMGRFSVRTLKDMAAGHRPTSSRMKLATQLIRRSSTAPPRP